MRVDVDRDLCESNAVCVGIAADIFELDDEDLGHAAVGVHPLGRDLVRVGVDAELYSPVGTWILERRRRDGMGRE